VYRISAFDLSVAGQVVWHHARLEPPPTDAELRQDARFAATAWFSDPQLLSWLQADVQAGKLQGAALQLAQAIMAAVDEGASLAEQAPTGFDPAAHEADAPRIYDWSVYTGTDGARYLIAQRIENHPHIRDGNSLGTSTALVWLDTKLGWARTRSRYYRLMDKQR
jgi:hypothetical protein